MNWDQIEGKWKQFSGKIKKRGGKLTDDDCDPRKAHRLVGSLQECYGLAKDQVEHQIDEFTRSLRESESRQQASKTRGAGS